MGGDLRLHHHRRPLGIHLKTCTLLRPVSQPVSHLSSLSSMGGHPFPPPPECIVRGSHLLYLPFPLRIHPRSSSVLQFGRRPFAALCHAMHNFLEARLHTTTIMFLSRRRMRARRLPRLSATTDLSETATVPRQPTIFPGTATSLSLRAAILSSTATTLNNHAPTCWTIAHYHVRVTSPLVDHATTTCFLRTLPCRQ